MYVLCMYIVFSVPPVIRRGPKSADVLEGEDIEFTCQVSGTAYPVTNILWEKDNNNIKLVISGVVYSWSMCRTAGILVLL